MILKSKIYSLNKTDFQNLVYKCNSLAEILRKLDLYVSSGNYRPLKIRLKEENIDFSHITLGYKANKGKKFLQRKIPLSELLIKNSTKSNNRLKEKLIENSMLENKCIICKLDPIWENKNLVLQLDHINGDSRDNRIENLRILCPNCHTQTPTYGSKNREPKIIKEKYCICGNKICKKATLCKKCSNKNKTYHPTKIIWPNNEELLKLLESNNYIQLAKKLGVSDTAIRKRLKENH